MHDKDIREYRIDNRGLHVGKPYRNTTNILSGQPIHITSGEIERIGSLFQE